MSDDKPVDINGLEGMAPGPGMTAASHRSKKTPITMRRFRSRCTPPHLMSEEIPRQKTTERMAPRTRHSTAPKKMPSFIRINVRGQKPEALIDQNHSSNRLDAGQLSALLVPVAWCSSHSAKSPVLRSTAPLRGPIALLLPVDPFEDRTLVRPVLRPVVLADPARLWAGKPKCLVVFKM